MIYETVEYILGELEGLEDERDLIENLTLMTYYCDSSQPGRIQKHFRKVIDRYSKLVEDDNVSYTLYITGLVLLFLKELKEAVPHITRSIHVFKQITVLCQYIEKLLRKECGDSEEYLDRKREIIELLSRNFSQEYYYRKRDRMLSEQYRLPF
jgi:hypothetical protein